MKIAKRFLAVAVASAMSLSAHAGESVYLSKPINFTELCSHLLLY